MPWMRAPAMVLMLSAAVWSSPSLSGAYARGPEENCVLLRDWTTPVQVEVRFTFPHGFYAFPCGCEQGVQIHLSEELRASPDWNSAVAQIMDQGGGIAEVAVVGQISTVGGEPDFLHIQKITLADEGCQSLLVTPSEPEVG